MEGKIYDVLYHLAGMARAGIDMIMPRTCAVCGRRLGLMEESLCTYCLADIPFTFFWDRVHNPMADRFNGMIERDMGDHPPQREEYAFAAALFFYRNGSGYREITKALKYRADFATGRFFASMLGERLASSEQFRDVDAVVPVPLHWTRRWRRGYNQAEVIARTVAESLGCPCIPGLLKRDRRTSSQTRLSLEDKTRNVSGAFSVHRKTAERTATPRHVLLVDDVFTTGSTLNACRRVLRGLWGPGTRISAATVAVVG